MSFDFRLRAFPIIILHKHAIVQSHKIHSIFFPLLFAVYGFCLKQTKQFRYKIMCPYCSYPF